MCLRICSMRCIAKFSMPWLCSMVHKSFQCRNNLLSHVLTFDLLATRVLGIFNLWSQCINVHNVALKIKVLHLFSRSESSWVKVVSLSFWISGFLLSCTSWGFWRFVAIFVWFLFAYFFADLLYKTHFAHHSNLSLNSSSFQRFFEARLAVYISHCTPVVLFIINSFVIFLAALRLKILLHRSLRHSYRDSQMRQGLRLFYIPITPFLEICESNIHHCHCHCHCTSHFFRLIS